MNKEKPVVESRLRSVLKGFSWRVIATSTTILVTYFVTGKIDTAITVGGLEFIGKIFIYYLHERLWLKIPRGYFRKYVRMIRGN